MHKKTGLWIFKSFYWIICCCWRKLHCSGSESKTFSVRFSVWKLLALISLRSGQSSVFNTIHVLPFHFQCPRETQSDVHNLISVVRQHSVHKTVKWSLYLPFFDLLSFQDHAAWKEDEDWKSSCSVSYWSIKLLLIKWILLALKSDWIIHVPSHCEI